MDEVKSCLMQDCFVIRISEIPTDYYVLFNLVANEKHCQEGHLILNFICGIHAICKSRTFNNTKDTMKFETFCILLLKEKTQH